MSWIITGTQREPPSPYLIDTFAGAAAAYSLRQLRTGNTNVVRVRRDNDNAEQDFTATEVSDGTLATWVGAGNDGFVRTWYDQSGNGRNAEQTTTANQPQVVSSGSLILQGSRPSLQFDDTNDSLPIASGLTGLARLDAFVVKNSTSSAHMTFTSTDGGVNYSWIAQSGSSQAGSNQWSTASPLLYVNGVLASVSVRNDVYNALNGYKIETTINGGTASWVAFRIGGYVLQWAYGGTMQEIVLYPSDQSSNRVAIETSINTYYAIY
jgi:hypothetical protein